MIFYIHKKKLNLNTAHLKYCKTFEHHQKSSSNISNLNFCENKLLCKEQTFH